MAKEIERKFIIDRMPVDISDYTLSSTSIIQSYLSINDNEEVRIRHSFKDDVQCFLTVKRGKGLERDEYEVNISHQTFLDLQPVHIKPLTKTRWYVVMSDIHMEIDVYTSKENLGLCIAEVEFDTAQEAEDFVPPEWFGQEVTEDKAYKNQSLWKKENGL